MIWEEFFLFTVLDERGRHLFTKLYQMRFVHEDLLC